MKGFVLLLICQLLAMTTSALNSVLILQPPNGTRLCVGDSITLQCMAIINDGPFRGSWTRNTVSYNSNSVPNHTVTFNSTGEGITDLSISNVGSQVGDIEYNCSLAGEMTRSIILHVLGTPTILSINETEKCFTYSAIEWTDNSHPVCGPVLYSATIIPSNGEMMMNIASRSHTFVNLSNDTNYIVSIAGVNRAGEGESRSMNVTTLSEYNPEISVVVKDVCVLSANISWSVNPMFCGDFSYQVEISPSPVIGMALVNRTETFYNFINLINMMNYTVMVNAVNNGGNFSNTAQVKLLESVDPPSVRIVLPPNGTITIGDNIPDDFDIVIVWEEPNITDQTACFTLPITRYNITATVNGTDTVNETNAVNGTDIVGGIDETVTVTVGITNISYKEKFQNVQLNTRYDFSVIALNTDPGGNVDDDDDDGGSESDNTGAIVGGAVGGTVSVTIIVVIAIGGGVFYYKREYKFRSGPSKIGMQDAEKTPSPVDEPVAYTTTETDKVTFGTSDSTDTKKKKQKKPEMLKKPAAEPAYRGGITYADIDIGKGPAAPGSIFPQDKPTYGQVKPSN